MNRFPDETAIHVDFIISSDEAERELHHRAWSVGHVAVDGVHQVSGYKGKAAFIAEAPTELDAWLLACTKANELEQLWLNRN